MKINCILWAFFFISAIDPCLGVVCVNGALCSQGLCQCEMGFTGQHCETGKKL